MTCDIIETGHAVGKNFYFLESYAERQYRTG